MTTITRSGRSPCRWLAPYLLLGASCVAYEAQDVSFVSLAAAAPAAPTGPLAWPEAVAFAFTHNHELRQLAALARAAGADVPATELQGQWAGDDRRLAAMLDPIALLRLGARGSAATLAAARAEAATTELAVARWRLVGSITEVYAAWTALDGTTTPTVATDPTPFAAAGLASPNAIAQARSAVATAAAERLALAADRDSLLAELRPLLGLPPTAALQLVPLAPTFPPLPPADEAQLRRRPDLALVLANHRVSDAEFRRAVAEQYPALMIGPDFPLGPGALDAMAWFRIPLGADGPALAAKERRDAARDAAATALLAAGSAAATAASQHEALAARADATDAMAAASGQALQTATAALAVEVDAFERFAERAQMALRDAMERRQAVVAAARARVRHAVAYGWPVAEELP